MQFPRAGRSVSREVSDRRSRTEIILGSDTDFAAAHPIAELEWNMCDVVKTDLVGFMSQIDELPKLRCPPDDVDRTAADGLYILPHGASSTGHL